MNFFNDMYDKYNIRLDKQQSEAVMHVDGPALVLAGPGSGKTTTIISRLAYLIYEKNISPSNILSMTFNRAAAVEMRKRFYKVFGESTHHRIRFSTLHSFAYSVFNAYAKSKNAKFTMIEGNNIKLNKKRLLKDIFLKVNGFNSTDEEIEELINEISSVKNRMIPDINSYSTKTSNFEQIFVAYEKYKKDNVLIDFDDLLIYTYIILKKYPIFLKKCRQKYKYIQIDEGQDISKIQFEVVRLITQPNNNLFIVADDDQSIYAFRGAQPENILNINKEYENCKIYYIENNYRSSRNIVQISSNFIKFNSQRYDKNHKVVKGDTQNPIKIEVEDSISQYTYLTQTIAKIMSLNPDSKIGILYRNNISSIPVFEVLERHGIDFNSKEIKPSFFNHWFVKDILAFFKFALDDKDEQSFGRIYYKMNRYISKNMLMTVLNCKEDIPVFDKILKYADLESFQEKNILNLKYEFKKLIKMTPLDILRYIEDEFKYLDNAKDYCGMTCCSFDYVFDMFSIMKVIAKGYMSIYEFLARIDVLKSKLASPQLKHNESNITLSTIHSAKGLEYDYVFIIDLVNSSFPGDKDMEEERRLFYVAMTRAKKCVYMLYPKTRNNNTVKHTVFVDEVQECINNMIMDNINVGSEVLHKNFGKGTVEKIKDKKNGTSIKIKFNKKSKTLDLNTCLENEIISLYNFRNIVP